MADLRSSALDVWLEQVISERLAGPAPLQGISRSPFRHIGSYDCDLVSAAFADGSTRKLFLKDFARSRQSKDFVRQRRNRELEVYRQLLDSDALGTPAFYGSRWDEDRGQFWMLLELVGGETVRQLDEHNGIPAVQWLARFQAHFQSHADQLGSADFLIEHDAEYFRSKSDDARRDVSRIAPDSRTRLEEVLSVYDTASRLAADQPVCLVHGGYIPWHIFVDRAVSPLRVAVVDWELAARGSLLYDLAIFIDDAEPQLQATLLDTYRTAALERGLPVSDSAEMTATVECFRVHRVIDWLSRSAEKSFSAKKIASLLTRAEAGCSRMLAAR